MTGGAELSRKINTGLARVAKEHQIAFGVGSQKIMLRHPELIDQFMVRDYLDDSVLFGNIGATLLLEHPVESIVGLVERIDADGLCVHLNPAQELIQDDGERCFSGLVERLSQLNQALPGRIMVKETGAGLGPVALKKLSQTGLSLFDVAGAGGTSWTKVESFRARSATLRRTGSTFANWGLPTAACLLAARRVLPDDAQVVASGGIVTGLDSARAMALGADLCGFARPVLEAFLDGGQEEASRFVGDHIHELKTAMLLTGSHSLEALRSAPLVIGGSLARWQESLEAMS